MPSDPPWLLSLATRQRQRISRALVRYDDGRQIAVIEDSGAIVPAIQSASAPETKKADIEKREDQKDRWQS